MDWFVPSPDGKLLAVCLSEHGSEEGTLHFYRTDTGERLPDRIARVQYPTGGGSAAWAPDGKSIFYTRYPRAGERPEADLNFFQQIYRHNLGTPESADEYSAGRDFPRIAEIDLATSRDRPLVARQRGQWRRRRIRPPCARLRGRRPCGLAAGDPVRGRRSRKSPSAATAQRSTCARLSMRRAGRSCVCRLTAPSRCRMPRSSCPRATPPSKHSCPRPSFLFVADLVGGPSRIRRFDLAGKNGRVLAAARHFRC